MGLSFTIAGGSHQCSHSQVRVQRDSRPYFTVSDSRLHKPGGPDPHIYVPQEQGGQVIPPGTVFPFHRLLQFVGLLWRYSTPPPHSRTSHRQSQSYVTTDGQSARLSWSKAPIWGLRPYNFCCMTVVGLMKWDALSDERMGLSFASHSQQ
jgi:hypothetical protein